MPWWAKNASRLVGQEDGSSGSGSEKARVGWWGAALIFVLKAAARSDDSRCRREVRRNQRGTLSRLAAASSSRS